jgi:hypothetical protein
VVKKEAQGLFIKETKIAFSLDHHYLVLIGRVFLSLQIVISNFSPVNFWWSFKFFIKIICYIK